MARPLHLTIIIGAFTQVLFLSLECSCKLGLDHQDNLYSQFML